MIPYSLRYKSMHAQLSHIHCKTNHELVFNPLPLDRQYFDDVPTKDMLVNFFCTLPICLQRKMHRRRAEVPPAVHFTLQTNRKSVQKKLTSTVCLSCPESEVDQSTHS